MATPEQINLLLSKAEWKWATLVNESLIDFQNGCPMCFNPHLERMWELISALTYQLEILDYTSETTQNIYSCLFLLVQEDDPNPNTDPNFQYDDQVLIIITDNLNPTDFIKRTGPPQTVQSILTFQFSPLIPNGNASNESVAMGQFENGIVTSAESVGLGGSLVRDTFIDMAGRYLIIGDGAYTGLSLVPGNAVLVGTSAGQPISKIDLSANQVILQYTSVSGPYKSISFGATNMTVTDTLSLTGLKNAGDYEANFTGRSLITKQYGDDNYAPITGGGYVPNARTLTINGTGYDLSTNRSWTVGDALIANPLSQFSATTSAQLRAVLSDETGNGAAYFQNGDLGTPSAGVATNLTGTATALNIGGNAATVTNGVYTTGSYANPAWITSLAWAKITGAPTSFPTPNAVTFNNGGAGESSGTTFDGSVARIISYNTIGAAPSTGGTGYIPNNATTTPSTGYSYNIDGSGNIGTRLGIGFSTVPLSALGVYNATLPLFTARNSTAQSVELITNTTDRDFSGTNNWTGTGWTFTAGLATHITGTANNAVLANANFTTGSIIIGREYVVTATFSNRNTWTMFVTLGGTAVLFSNTGNNGVYSALVVAGANNADLNITCATITDGSFTNISLKPVIPSVNIANNGSLYINSNANTLSPLLYQSGFTGLKPNLLNIQRSPIGMGTISVTASGTTVTGTGTDFANYFNVGDVIYANGETHTITAINSANIQTLTTDAWTSTFSGAYGTTVSNSLTYNSNGKLIINSNNIAGNVFSIFHNSNNVTGGVGGLVSHVQYSNTIAPGNGIVVGGRFEAWVLSTNTQNLTNTNAGVSAIYSDTTVDGTGTITQTGNYYSQFRATAPAITDAYIVRSALFSNTGTITNFTGYNTPALTGGGTVTNQTDFLAGAVNISGNWAFYNATSKSNFLGTAPTLIGSSTPTAGAPTVDVTGTIGSTALNASKLVFTDANKVLTSTGIGTSSQFLMADGSLNSNTYATNPLTTTGDIIYSSSGITAARLAIGSAGNVLTVSSGLPAWVNPNTANDLRYSQLSTTPQVVASYQQTAVTTVGTLLTYTVTTDGFYRVDGNIYITAIATNTMRVRIIATNVTGEAINITSNTVATAAAANSAGSIVFNFNNPGASMYLKAGTSLTVSTEDVVSGGTQTYNAVIKVIYEP